VLCHSEPADWFVSCLLTSVSSPLRYLLICLFVGIWDTCIVLQHIDPTNNQVVGFVWFGLNSGPQVC
jgi:hypothetical protein